MGPDQSELKPQDVRPAFAAQEIPPGHPAYALGEIQELRILEMTGIPQQIGQVPRRKVAPEVADPPPRWGKTAAEIPVVRGVAGIVPHRGEPGQKGIGESGAIGPPAAIANAVNDALAPLGAEVTEIPMTPERVLRAIAAAGGKGGAA